MAERADLQASAEVIAAGIASRLCRIGIVVESLAQLGETGLLEQEIQVHLEAAPSRPSILPIRKRDFGIRSITSHHAIQPSQRRFRIRALIFAARIDKAHRTSASESSRFSPLCRCSS